MSSWLGPLGCFAFVVLVDGDLVAMRRQCHARVPAGMANWPNPGYLRRIVLAVGLPGRQRRLAASARARGLSRHARRAALHAPGVVGRRRELAGGAVVAA